MPWKESSVMEERLRFVGRLLQGDSMAAVCREFGISRKTGYKIFDRYKEHGLRRRCRVRAGRYCATSIGFAPLWAARARGMRFYTRSIY
jgi:transposase